MDIKRVVLAGFVSLFLMAGPVQAGDETHNSGDSLVLDMKDAVKMGLDRSHRVQAHDYGIKRSESEVKSVRGQFFPQLSALYLSGQPFRPGADGPGLPGPAAVPVEFAGSADSFRRDDHTQFLPAGPDRKGNQ